MALDQLAEQRRFGLVPGIARRGDREREGGLHALSVARRATTMTVRLGSMLVVGFGVMIAALKFLQC